MRATRILRATAQTGLRYLEPGQPTGLTGLLTHKSPRGALIAVYSSTLDKLKQLPQSSVYRQSTEALTRHRLAIVEAAKPEGIEAWQQGIRGVVEKSPEAFEVVKSESDPRKIDYVERLAIKSKLELEDNFSQQVRAELDRVGQEPQLSIEQIGQVEVQIAAGLIEEVLQVAQGESKLVDTMVENKVWEDLEEKPAEGQWVYHERDRHTPITQAP